MRSTTRSNPRSATVGRLLASVGLAIVVAGSLAACGADATGDDVASLATGDNAGGTSTTVARPLTEEEIAEAQEAFQDCMQEHGVDIQIARAEADGTGGGMIMRTEGAGPGEDGEPPADLPTKEEMDEAQEACQPLIEEVIQNAPKPDPEELARMKEQALEFARCMRDNGVDMPDPQFSDDGGVTQALGSPDGEIDPDMDTAMEACRELMKGPNGEAPPMPGPAERAGRVSNGDAGGDR